MIKKILFLIIVFIAGFYFGSQGKFAAKEGLEIKAIENVNVVDVAVKFKEDFPNKKAGFEFDVIAKVPTGSVEFFKINDQVDEHYHANENHILYITKGRAMGTVGDVEKELNAGDLVIVPAGVHHSLKNLEEDPFEFILFSTPAFNPEDIEFVKE